MKEKVYSLNGSAVDSEGRLHRITIAGLYTQETEFEPRQKIVQVPIDENKSVDGCLLFSRKQVKRKLRYGYAICHEDDVFNEEIGVKLALKRAKTSPMGELETKYVTTLCQDQIKHILQGELKHLIDNVDKYMKTKA